MKKYRVTLTPEERSALKELIRSGKYKNTKLKRAQLLLGADESPGGKAMKDEELSKAYDAGRRTVERLRQRFIEDGFDLALNGKPRPVNARIKIDGDAESFLVATACSEAPAGYEKWTVKLLAGELKKNGYVVEISEEAVRQTLKKTKRNPGARSISS